jgi:hypothetical protein
MKHFFSFSLAVLTAVMGAIIAPSAYALMVSPVAFDFEGTPGGSARGVIRLTNDSERSDTFSLEARNFIPYGEEGAQTYLEEEEVTGLASWVRFDQPSVFLQAGQTAEFPFVVAVPPDAEPGGHYAAIFFSRVPDKAQGTGVGVGGAVGVLLLMNVSGEIHEEARIESFTVREGAVHDRLPIYFDLRIRNLGSVHFRPRGELMIRNVFGNVVNRSDVNPKNSAVLPNSVRRVESVWARTLQEQEGGFFVQAKEEWRNFAIGPYTAAVEMRYGSQAWQLSSAQMTFWVFPWRLLLLTGVAVLLIVVLLVSYHRLVVASVVAKERKRTTGGAGKKR